MDGIPQKRSFQSPRKAKPPPHSNPKPSHSSTYPIPQTPQTIIPCGSSLQVSTPETLASRRSSRRASLDTPQKSNHCKTSRSSFSPVSPDQSEASKRKRGNQAKGVVTNAGALRNLSFEKGEEALAKRRRVYYKKVVYDGREFVVGDDVYVKRREDPEIEECMACFKAGKAVMVACDDCLGGFHLKCLNPPLKDVPEGDWVCWFCKDQKMGIQSGRNG